MIRRWRSIKSILYFILFLFSTGYFLVCLIYAGIAVSWLFIWPVAAVFCLVRFIMLRRQIKGRKVWQLPRFFRVLYRLFFIAGVCIFVYVEGLVIGGMRTQPQAELPYIIVLGAGLRGSAPTRPLLLRMQAAAEYLEANPDTVAIASGGQGPDEDMSEAQCIYEYLTEKGITPSRILLEDQSENTEENIENSFSMIPDETTEVGILSNGFHIYRATRIAQKLGHDNVSGIPSRTLMPMGLHYMVREFFAIIKMEVFG